MKRYTILFALFIAFRFNARAQAFIVPATGNDNASILSCDSVQITSSNTFQQGTVWYRNQLDLNSPFDYTFKAYFGTFNGQGADGMDFIIQNQSQALGPQGALGGAQLGYTSFPGKSLAIEFDTHNNGPGAPYGDIGAHHIAIDTGGVQFPPAAAAVPALPSSANIDDGTWHTIEIVWAPATQTMTIFFDGNLRLSYVFNPGLVTSVFGGQNMLYWGWAGCTGSKYNLQQIYIPFKANFTAAVNYTQCGLTNVPFTDSSIAGLNNITSWAWDFGDGNTSTQRNPVHTFAQSGQYNVKLTVTDAAGCSVDTSIKVSVYSVPVITPSQTNVTCFGAGNGSAHATVTGGTPAYTYTWTPAVSTVSNAFLLTPGTYNLKVTDHNGCTATTTYTITQPPALTDSFTQLNVRCYGQSSGSLVSVANGGTPGYTYLWNPNISSSASALNLPAGSYSTTVVDANGCRDSIQTTITQPTLLTASLSDSNVRCYGASTGYIIVTANGGTPAYTYNWNPNVSVTGSALNIPAGNYAVTVTDANGCSLTQSAVITQPASALTLSATAIPVLCYGYPTGTIIAKANGGTPTYTYTITSGSNTVSNDSGGFHNLLPLTYLVAVTDNNACYLDTTVTVNQPPQLVIDSTPVISPLCYGYRDGQIKVSASGGTPGYSYSFSNGVNNTNGIVTGLAAGTYSATVTDNSGCPAYDSGIVLIQPDSVMIEVTPTPIQVILGDQLQLGTNTNQNGPVTYSWKPEFGLSCYDCPDPVFNGVFSQPYRVTVTNQNGCSGSFPFTVDVVPEYNIFFPNAFVPAGTNNTWQVYGKTNAVLEFHVAVFDRVGEKVFESNSVNYQWDGTYKGAPAPMGVYTYMARIVWLNDYTEKLFEGTVTLLR